ncbi:PREDICTED: pathogenesis-related homeodomain protein-like isoform X1 [Populus euphratica]|uniref:Pathogenesis-related homeodomain protein-like isoform X1 n=1 Tax=Populus euphratica TaxID=75702 RepID=A0AAJ6XIL0_POPEU|nr:PREDICTED: pathogenesis-related homeodomain protein-like isoform X1 [Populus euphratica]XP_011020022.1 PREDICTED: pathogenesis-related homeodomain protein-like isoform X1 [Populus euphratica]XP_011020023.1 PREDICTED: pathogenesis-related homeodomain protein-like isoform X1 [Populus euphratica]XP_011020024.1 PREDICTED: pathogenesis-related homeodomain protein-like isoform X1 [Populus euphratica]
MGDSGKTSKLQDSHKCSPSDTVTGSLLIKSLKIKKDSKMSPRKGQKTKTKSKPKPKPIPHLKSIISSAVSKRKVSPKGIGNGSTSRKLIHRKILHKALDKKASRKGASSELQLSTIDSKGNGKNGDEGAIKKLKKRKPKKRQRDKVKLDEPSRLQRRARYLMIKMKLDQNLIDAYSGEGWKGQSREKIRPEKELLRARKQILKCKLGLRDIIRQVDSLSTVGCIEETVMAPDGSVSHEHIFCAKCKLNEVSPDNDIVLCDGTCNCAFHQKCLEPPLDTESIPPGDQGWFCKFCECRMDIIEAMNAHLGTHFSEDSSWQDIFTEAAAIPDAGNVLLNPEEEWPSDDSEDDNYDPERRDNIMSEACTDNDASDDISSSTSLGWSSDGEVFLGSRRWEMHGLDFRNNSIYSSLDSDETSDGEIVCGRRQRRAIDYKMLYDEVFGKDAPANEQASEDEDWGPGKRKRREKESNAASTLMTLCESEKKSKSDETIEGMMKLPPQTRRPIFRLPPDAVEKLRQVFVENELPSRTVKENLSKELGLEPGKVSKWFKNSRYLALKSRKVEKGEQLHNSSSKVSAEPTLNVREGKTADLSQDSWEETEVCIPKNLKRILQRKKPKSISRSSRKNEQKRGSYESPTKSNEMNAECSDDVSLKKLLKAKPKEVKKKVNPISTAAEYDMERLCRAKAILEKMKQKVVKLQNGKARKSSKTRPREEFIVYIPIAELRGKN